MITIPRPAVALVLALAVTAPHPAHAQIEPDRVPLQTAITELHRLREEYAQAYNKKDAAALAAMYSTDAVLVTSAGAVFVGNDAIRTAFIAAASTFPHLVITSDTLRVFGNTAVDQGTLLQHPEGGGEITHRYLAVLRRGLQEWKIIRVMSVPVPD